MTDVATYENKRDYLLEKIRNLHQHLMLSYLPLTNRIVRIHILDPLYEICVADFSDVAKSIRDASSRGKDPVADRLLSIQKLMVSARTDFLRWRWIPKGELELTDELHQKIENHVPRIIYAIEHLRVSRK